MNFRADIYSPLQNLSLWTAAWLHHQESFDACDEAWQQLGGPHRIADGEFASTSLFACFRQAHRTGYVLRLLLGGAGHPLPLPPQHPIAASAAQAGGAIVMEHPLEGLEVFVPDVQSAAGADHTDWYHAVIPGPTISAPWLSPGDADTQLREVSDQAAQRIAERSGSAPLTREAPNPRLTVGTLTDYYDVPGLPAATPQRTSGLIARANTVTAIVETTMQRYGIHEYDPELLRLGRAIRQARMSAVDYAVAEWGRRAG